jgi:hypothetical protein
VQLQLLPTLQHEEEDIEAFRNRSGTLVKQWLKQQHNVCSLPPSLTDVNLSNSSCDNNCIAVVRSPHQTSSTSE